LEKEEFLADISKRSAKELAVHYFERAEATAFPVQAAYAHFKSLVQHEVGGEPQVVVVGTGNWKFSLNPHKGFKTFDANSDIDVAVVSHDRFHQTWEELRKVHRKTWWALGNEERNSLLRYGQDVYSGFVTPGWIPSYQNTLRFDYLSMLNRLSNQSPGKREVKMMFFKNNTEAIDYYRRGFQLAKWSIK
jgi:hypothetical protein